MTNGHPVLLFVYGTLKATATSAMGLPERARLGRESRHLGPATTVGLLFDLGGYPGLVIEPAGLVHGELLELQWPDATLAWLDRYEGLEPAGTGEGTYERIILEIERPGGARTTAWVYACRHRPPGHPIPSGS